MSNRSDSGGGSSGQKWYDTEQIDEAAKQLQIGSEVVRNLDLNHPGRIDANFMTSMIGELAESVAAELGVLIESVEDLADQAAAEAELYREGADARVEAVSRVETEVTPPVAGAELGKFVRPEYWGMKGEAGKGD